MGYLFGRRPRWFPPSIVTRLASRAATVGCHLGRLLLESRLRTPVGRLDAVLVLPVKKKRVKCCTVDVDLSLTLEMHFWISSHSWTHITINRGNI